MADNKQILEGFKRSVEITRDARFQANLRLSQRERLSSYVIATLSTVVIFLSLIPNFSPVSQQQSQMLLAGSIIMSVFIIFSSLIDAASNFYHRGESLHQCARGVAQVFQDAKLIDPDDANFNDQIQKLRKRYFEILDSCPFNHENIDYLKAKIQKPSLFIDQGYSSGVLYYVQRLFDYIRYYIGIYSWIVIHLVAVIGIIVVLRKYIFI